MNKNTCIKWAFFMQFTQNESLEKFRREGMKQRCTLDDVTEGRATEETFPLLQKLAKAVQKGSLCALGKTAPNPVLSLLTHFKNEYDAHVFQKRCPAKNCKALLGISIDPALCKGCGLCAKKCPVQAITGERKAVHTIDEEKCIQCGVCVETCKFNAVVRG